MANAGWADAFRLLHSDERRYSYWNTRGGRTGFRIDHGFVSPKLAPTVGHCELLHEPDSWPSDHAALLVELTP
jgi:exonuclease III